MRTTPFFSFLFALLTVLSLLAACSPPDSMQATQIPENTPDPASTNTPTARPTASPMPTPGELVIPPEAVEWLQNHAVPFDTAEPGNGCEDLQPLLEMIGEARVVAMGEATHGTHEFFTIKERIFECLVMEKDFNIFAMETGWAEANRVNAYVNGGSYPGFLDFSDMILWMRHYNGLSANARKLSFRGFDMQWGDSIIEDLLTYLNNVDPVGEAAAREALECYLAHVLVPQVGESSGSAYSQAGEEIQSRCKQGLQAVYDLFKKNQEAYESASSPIEFAEASYLVTLLMQNEQITAAGVSAEGWNLRDRFMAENISWLLDQAGPNAKMVVSAHNGHVTPAGWTWSDAECSNCSGADAIPMGAHLRAMYGENLIVVGLGFGRGSFWAMGENMRGVSLGYDMYTITDPIPRSHETYLLTAGLPRFFLDLRPMRSDPAFGDWFQEPRYFTSIGMVYYVDDPLANASLTVLPDEFDILIFIAETTLPNN